MVPSLFLLAGCLQPDPAVLVATDYYQRLQPLLLENSLLAERVLFEAARQYNAGDKPAPVAVTWTTDIVPLAEHLHHQASFVSAPEPFVERHSELVDLWGRRALLYRQLGEAVYTSDLPAWTDANKKNDELKLEEERWFDRLNESLAPIGLVVDPYP